MQPSFHIETFSELTDQILATTRSEVETALNSRICTLDDLAALLSPAAEEFLPMMAARSRELTAIRFGKTTQIFAPLYLSNFCINKCAYCGFAADNAIPRKKLTLDEVELEANILKQRGFDHVLLVTGEAPAKAGVEYLEEVVLRLKNIFAALSIEVQPMEQEEYARLFRAGVTAVAVYQETYDRRVY
ncbi:MAG TPA: radical SAM protein, partial [Desulfobulbaceae bacterium]|nr:radical SAM protein [Desulfobulbaceae bacterium]